MVSPCDYTQSIQDVLAPDLSPIPSPKRRGAGTRRHKKAGREGISPSPNAVMRRITAEHQSTQSLMGNVELHIIHEEIRDQRAIGGPQEVDLDGLALVTAQRRGNVEGVLRPAAGVGITLRRDRADGGAGAGAQAHAEVVVAGAA